MVTGWKRRSSAESDSKCLRYSAMVVAPMTLISPRARAGLRMLAASSEPPSVRPAPTRVWISSMNSTMPGLALASLMMALSRSSKVPRYLVPATSEPIDSSMMRMSARRFGGLVAREQLGHALDHGGLADAGVAEQQRVGLLAAHQRLHDRADLLLATDDVVELAGPARAP